MSHQARMILGVAFAVMLVVGPGCKPQSPSPAGDLPVGSESPIDCDTSADLRRAIEGLEADGLLSHGRATALSQKLDQAERLARAGRTDEANDVYAQLIRQIEGWVDSGTLSDEGAQDLITCGLDVADGPDLTFIAIAPGKNHTCGLIETGAAYCWGSNSSGELGNGTNGMSNVPVAVKGGHSFQSISASGEAGWGAGAFTCAVTVGGAVYCWGHNGQGELGNGSTTASDVPVPIAANGLTFEQVDAGGNHACAVTQEGAVYCWGEGHKGQLGIGTLPADRCKEGPLTVPCSTTPVPVKGALVFESVSAGRTFTCGVSTTKKAYCWGYDSMEQALGNGPGSPDDCGGGCSLEPIPVNSDFTFADVSAGGFHACGVTTSGSGLCWGRNIYGQLGNGLLALAEPSPVAVEGGHEFSSVSASNFFTCGLTSAGAAFCWGADEAGVALGDATDEPYCDVGDSRFTRARCSDEPVAVQGGHHFVQLTAGSFYHTCGITMAGDAYCWGYGVYGGLGNGGNDPSSLPVRVISP